ncbi:hypothetical protein EQP59_10070 [Ornithobacterium rhinotracheale]|uniref:Lipoprotein n=1 Tax=Ornithobacterium rhinotracheale TaxID=28251 RepID=A0A410JUC4_ORNRH|nr:hypothetical protein [Ornithobacterium rhinotracheale]QAR31661.1 hypothetical protein EQP59_10070 [Ornithobacterium rhinotracheale]
MKNLIKLLFLAFFITGCNFTADSNTAARVIIPLYKNGEKDFQKDDFSNNFYSNITFKVEPEKGNSFTLKNKKALFTDLWLPLYLEESYKCSSTDCKTKENNVDEVFRLTISYQDREIFNKKLKLKYARIGQPFESIETASFFDEEDKTWKPYKPEKTPLLNEQGQPTGYEFEVEL